VVASNSQPDFVIHVYIILCSVINQVKEEYTECSYISYSRHEDVLSIHLPLWFKTGPSCL
jgi:hypothetical protein